MIAAWKARRRRMQEERRWLADTEPLSRLDVLDGVVDRRHRFIHIPTGEELELSPWAEPIPAAALDRIAAAVDAEIAAGGGR